MLTRMRSAVLLIAPLAACLVDDAGPIDEDHAALNACPNWGCGTNAASMGDGIAFHELDWSGREANDVQVRVVSFALANGAPVRMRVVGHTLQGIERNGTVRFGTALEGSIIELAHPQSRFQLKIEDVSETEFWVGIGPDVPTYKFLYREIGRRDQWFPLCEGLGLADDRQWDGIRQIALVFRGDRYDGIRKVVTATGAATGTWFNVACAGTTPAKLHLLRHTDAGTDAAHVTTRLQRQAMLKMLTADYCGRGRSFTTDGHPLKYMDAQGWYPFQPNQVRSYESIWTHAGAVCLDEPRRLLKEPTIGDDIRRECARPSCAAMLPTWTTHGYVLSGNPI